jgi:cyclophilin family peptidyl-prolyl cis-trans isomerase/HEAT repeat protein
MQFMGFRNTLSALLLLAASMTGATAQRPRSNSPATSIPVNTLLRILRAEDQRRWDDNLKSLMADKDAKVRKRAALAAGRIGDELSVPPLAELLKRDSDPDVRQMAAFAIGEIESPVGGDVLVEELGRGNDGVGGAARARAVEALGKIAAVLSESDKERKASFGAAILGALRFEADRRSRPDTLTILLGLTAVLRAKPEGAGAVVTKFLGYADPRIVADALNTMARLRLKDNNDQVRRLLKYRDRIVRANAARVIGAAEDKGAFDAVLDRALHDGDLRVRVSAIRALGSLKDERAVLPLSRRGVELFTMAHLQPASGGPRNEGLEILTALGLILAARPQKDTGPESAARKELSLAVRAMSDESILEDEVFRARVSSTDYLDYLDEFEATVNRSSEQDARRAFYTQSSVSARAGGLAEPAKKNPLPEKTSQEVQLRLRRMLADRRTPLFAVPNILNSYAVYKPSGLSETLREYLQNSDVIVRATAAELLGNQPPDDANSRSLAGALPRALRDKDLNDAALAILDALGKQKSPAANEAIKPGLDSSDHLIRRRAVALLKANGAGDFSRRIGYVQTRYTEADYRRDISRIGKKVTATVVTSKGAFTIEFLPEAAPLTVDNFVMLARRGYFNGQTVPRVVPNFVIQTGDPRGDQNGGPGYSIRCEINQSPYDRGAVGMALSGKDTGGSQWFVTHSPQPHLDGGYTVFGRVTSGMDVVDRIARGDTIRRVIVNER